MGTLRYRILPVLLASLCLGPCSTLYGEARSATQQDARHSGAIVRERQRVVVGSGVEEWRLEWQAPPEPACEPSRDDWYTCPCVGFAFGETGQLDLVRHVQGKPEERLHLSPLFALGFYGEAVAQLPKWPVLAGDMDRMDKPGFADLVKSRPIVRIMELADYDHDGRPTEFLLQIGAGPCGHRQTVVVGVSRSNPKLHAFGTVAHPWTPLVLESPDAWKQLLGSKGKTTVVSWPCGDHGSDEQDEIELVAEASAGIRAFHARYSCGDTARGRLLERVEQ
ncbi:MAG: hypothetical protein HGA60_04430 [Chlorobiaceae bacterium]|nr:hypothetical protein [Chlorobiaceae bacterium]